MKKYMKFLPIGFINSNQQKSNISQKKLISLEGQRFYFSRDPFAPASYSRRLLEAEHKYHSYQQPAREAHTFTSNQLSWLYILLTDLQVGQTV